MTEERERPDLDQVRETMREEREEIEDATPEEDQESEED